jgi:hypothetical protein
MAARMTEIAELGIPREVLADALGVVRALVVYHVPARLKALAMYATAVSRPS